VQAILTPLPPLRQVVVHASAIIFPPRRLTALRQAAGIVHSAYRAPAHLVDSVADLGPLLEAAFMDGIDFAMFPRPTPFALAADHHDWTRIFAMSKSHLGAAHRRRRRSAGAGIPPEWSAGGATPILKV
jgi:hypothetical protein